MCMSEIMNLTVIMFEGGDPMSYTSRHIDVAVTPHIKNC